MLYHTLFPERQAPRQGRQFPAHEDQKKGPDLNSLVDDPDLFRGGLCFAGGYKNLTVFNTKR